MGAIHSFGWESDLMKLVVDAMQLFAQSQDKWSKTWPESEEDRAMRMYVLAFSSKFVNRADVRDIVIT